MPLGFNPGHREPSRDMWAVANFGANVVPPSIRSSGAVAPSPRQMALEKMFGSKKERSQPASAAANRDQDEAPKMIVPISLQVQHGPQTAPASALARRGNAGHASSSAKTIAEPSSAPPVLDSSFCTRGDEEQHTEQSVEQQGAVQSTGSRRVPTNVSADDSSREKVKQTQTNEVLAKFADSFDIQVQSDKIQAHQPVHMRNRDTHASALANPVHRRRLRAAIMAVQLGISDKWSDNAEAYSGLKSSSRPKPGSGKKVHPHSAERRKLIDRMAASLAEQEHYVELAYEADYLGLDNEDGDLDAANAYDARHVAAAHFTQARAATLSEVPTSISHSDGFRAGLLHVMRNRFFVPETYDPFGPIVTPRERQLKRLRRFHKGRKKWSMETSIWAPRKTKGVSKDYFETTQCLHEMLASDWHMARQHHELAWKICKAQLTDSELKDLDINDRLDGVLHHPVVEGVYKVLMSHTNLIYNAFDAYAESDLKFPKGVSCLRGLPLFSISLTQFQRMVADVQVVSEDGGSPCNYGACINVFSVANAPDKRTSSLESHNDAAGLSRHEFLQSIVLLSMLKFCKFNWQGRLKGNVADAVDNFCHDHLLKNLDRVARPGVRNLFRKRFCYREDVSLVLEDNKETLHSLFSVYASVGNAGKNDLALLEDKALMSSMEFYLLVQHLGLIEMGLISPRRVIEAFLWSRIRCARDYSDKEETRLRHHSFEDFLEAFVRMASIVAVPTLQEVEDAGAADGGDFLLTLCKRAPQKTAQAFLMGRTTGWDDYPCARMFICVKHLLELCRAVVIANCSTDPEKVHTGPLTTKIVEHFCRRRTQFENVPLAAPSTGCDVNALISSMAAIEEHLVQVIASVPAFKGLSEDNVRTLRNAMRPAKFPDGEYVFEQGDIGDSFYLITGGTCDVLRYDPNDPEKEEFVLNTLGAPDCFGETALITNAPRNATIEAKGDLYCLFIDRESFEEVLGPLSNYQVNVHVNSKGADSQAEPEEEATVKDSEVDEPPAADEQSEAKVEMTEAPDE